MRYVVGIPLLLLTLALAVGAVTGRVRARSCCSLDAAHDARLRGVQVGDARLPDVREE